MEEQATSCPNKIHNSQEDNKVARKTRLDNESSQKLHLSFHVEVKRTFMCVCAWML